MGERRESLLKKSLKIDKICSKWLLKTDPKKSILPKICLNLYKKKVPLFWAGSSRKKVKNPVFRAF
jgi:hypothetical protein